MPSSAVNYGVYTNEVDSAVTAHLPDLAKGANVDDVAKAIQAQAEGQIQ
jgi:lactose/L-arabinose transport system substrate-binding protein